MRVERVFLGLVSLLLVSGFGGLAAGMRGGRPALPAAGQGLLGAAVGLACLPLVAPGITLMVDPVRGRA